MSKTGRAIYAFVLLGSYVLFCNMDTITAITMPREFDFRYTTYEELMARVPVFQHPDVVGYVQLVVDPTRDQLLVGARGCLFRLSLDNLTTIEEADWKAENFTIDNCKRKGLPDEDCENFVRVLVLHENRVFTCGTNAFSPTCTWREADNLGNVSVTMPGTAKCPYSPHYNATALMTTDGNYYSATVMDITSRDPAILRHDMGSMPRLRTVQHNSKWLNEPDFVSSYEIGDFVYFFFRESAVEYINCGKKKYSRVARVCKNDRGGGNFLLEDNWTTYFKARMNCSLPGEYPFYYDEIQSTFFMEREQLLYAIFTTQMNSIAGSALCVFNMSSFNNAFTGPYKHQDTARSSWERHENLNPLTECPATSYTNKRSFMEQKSQQMITAQKYQMMDNSVQPVTTNPLLTGTEERWTHVVVDHVQGKKHEFEVVFVATDDGRIRKMTQVLNTVTNTSSPCLLEEIKIVPNGEPKPVKSMKISPEKGAIYISTLEKIIKIPVQRCERFTDNDLCLNSNDPYCGWNALTLSCTTAPGGNPNVHYWFQAMQGCPVVEHPVDGQWSVWSPWTRCKQVGSQPDEGDCLCRSRSCDDPKPIYGGRQCPGVGIEVANCTTHGQWTQWSEWSSCSQSCGTAVRTRRRHCGNPPPRYGGRICIGSSRDEEYCAGNPSCPLPPIHGNWTVWTPWNDCSAKCHGGIQVRRRDCGNPPPGRDGIPCAGNKQEWRMCNTHKCEEVSKPTPWTPWVKTNYTNGGYFEQRYRFQCQANVPEKHMIKTKHQKTQSRFCLNGGTCKNPGELRNSIDTSSPIDRVLKKYCKFRKRLFKKYCKCRTLGIFLVCQKCGYG